MREGLEEQKATIMIHSTRCGRRQHACDIIQQRKIHVCGYPLPGAEQLRSSRSGVHQCELSCGQATARPRHGKKRNALVQNTAVSSWHSRRQNNNTAPSWPIPSAAKGTCCFRRPPHLARACVRAKAPDRQPHRSGSARRVARSLCLCTPSQAAPRLPPPRRHLLPRGCCRHQC